MEGAGANGSPQATGPKLRGIARFCINTFRVFYARAAFARPAPVPLPAASTSPTTAAAAFSRRHRGGLLEEESFEAMGNLQSDARRKGRKGKGASAPGSVEDGLEDGVEAEDGGGEAEETVGRKAEQAGIGTLEKRQTHKRQAPKPPAEKKVFRIFASRFDPLFFERRGREKTIWKWWKRVKLVESG